MSQQSVRYKQNRIQQLRGFCFAAQEGSMTRAAERLYLSQPSVSLQIKALESELDVVLFERHGPNITLTHDGEILYQLAHPMVESFNNLEADFQSSRDSLERGSVKIAAGGSTILYVLPDYVAKFSEQHPGIDLQLMNVTGKKGMEMLRAREVDFCVGPLLDTPDDIEFHPIVSYDSMLITSRGHRLATKKRVTPRDIAKCPLILPPRHLSTWRQVEFVFTQEHLNYHVKLEVGGWEVIKKYVELGLGVSIVMSICLTENENLEIIDVKKYFPRRTYGVVMRKGTHLSPQARAFIAIMDPESVNW